MSNLIGLKDKEVKDRRLEGLVNKMPTKTTRTYLQIIQANVFNFINNVLYVICLILLILGYTGDRDRIGDAFATISVVLVNIIVGLSQEIRAKQKLDSIALLNRPKVTLLRDSKEKKVDPDEIVMNDLIIIKPGDQAVVDGIILESNGVQFDESPLTGESDVIKKQIGSQVLSGSFCVAGSCIFEVTKVGEDCVSNKIASGAASEKQSQTPLQKEINLVIRILIIIAFYLAILILISNLINFITFDRQDNLTISQENIAKIVGDMGVVIGLVPNGLFLMVTLAYTLGSLRLVGKGALVQELNAVESLSNVEILCLDKTGTITSGELEFEKIEVFDNLASEYLAILVNNQATLNATSEAIKQKFQAEKQTVTKEIPFSSQYKWSGISLENYKMKTLILAAPEVILKKIELENEKQDILNKYIEDGFRCLLLVGSTEILENEKVDLPENLQILGIVLIKDKLRPNLKNTLNEFTKSGVDFKIISGDNPKTVSALVRQAGIAREFKCISGESLDKMSSEEFENTANKYEVFGRITPVQKADLVKAMQARGRYVAMIGDGVNDVLSLKTANLGIAMESGTQATRSIAGIVLLKNNFGILPTAFLEGQRIRSGMQNVMSLFLTRVLFTILIIISIGLTGSVFPFTIKQNSLLALFAAGLPAFGLTFWAQPNKKHKKSLIRGIIDFVLPAGFILSIFALIVYLLYTLINIYLIYSSNNDAVAVDFIAIGDNAQVILTVFVIFAALSLVLFISPINNFFKTGIELSKSRKPAYFAIFLAVVILFLIFGGDQQRLQSLDLVVLNIWDVLYILSFLILWVITIRYVWKEQLFARYLGLKTRES